MNNNIKTVITAHSFESVLDLCDNNLVENKIIYLCYQASDDEVNILKSKVSRKKGLGIEVSSTLIKSDI